MKKKKNSGESFIVLDIVLGPIYGSCATKSLSKVIDSVYLSVCLR